jgi:hypothetical protein
MALPAAVRRTVGEERAMASAAKRLLVALALLASCWE